MPPRWRIAWRFPCAQRVRCRRSARKVTGPCWSTLVRCRGDAAPAGFEQAQPEILVLRQRVAPWPRPVADDAVQCRQAIELAVAAHTRGPLRRPARLVQEAVDGDLDFPKPRQQARAVVDPDKDLDAADAIVVEMCCRPTGWCAGRACPSASTMQVITRSRGHGGPAPGRHEVRRAAARRRSIASRLSLACVGRLTGGEPGPQRSRARRARRACRRWSRHRSRTPACRRLNGEEPVATVSAIVTSLVQCRNEEHPKERVRRLRIGITLGAQRPARGDEEHDRPCNDADDDQRTPDRRALGPRPGAPRRASRVRSMPPTHRSCSSSR